MASQIRFLGSSLRGVSSNLGLARDSSQVTIELVDDLRFGDSFNPPAIGSPVSFSIGSFIFNGITQNYEQTKGQDGNPLYSVILTDPKEVLAGAFVITGGYTGAVTSVPNLYNAYGFFEAGSFGASKSNSAGMQWTKIKQALTTLCNGSSQYGTYLNLKGYNYSLDLSALPDTPPYYRLGGNFGIGLLDAIDQVCRDGGADYYITLEAGNVIKVNVISRQTQPPLGTISSFINSRSGDVVNNRVGLELRNDVTSSFVVGDNIHDIFLGDTINLFYGFDIDGVPIVATHGYDDEDTVFRLNSASISDITGSTTYNCTHGELRMALENELMWSSYVSVNNQEIKELLDIQGDVVLNKIDIDKINAKEHVRKGKAPHPPEDAFNGALNKQARVFEFVRNAAQTYYGRKFIVRIPDLEYYDEDESNRRITSLEVADSGWNEQVDDQLQLTEDQADLLKDDTNRFRAFVKYNDAPAVQWQLIDPGSTVLTSDTNGLPVALFVKAEIDRKILFLQDGNFVVVTLSQPILAPRPNNEIGDNQGAAEMLVRRDAPDRENKVAQTKAALDRLMKTTYFTGDTQIGIYNRVVKPNVVAIPLKDNTNVYGPWSAAGPGGKTEVRQSGELAPWNFNGESLMNTAGQAQVYGGRTQMQESESGSLTLVGEPVASLGGVLSTNGPNLTNISIQYDARGQITTTYIFRSFTKTFGNTSQISRVIQNQGNTQTRNRRVVNEQIRASKARANIELDSGLARIMNAKDSFNKRWKGQTPHECITAGLLDDLSDSTLRIPGASLATFEEIRDSILRDDNTNFQKNAVMSLTGLLRPFSTRYDDTFLSCYTLPSGNFELSQSGLNPLRSGHDVAYLAFGDTNSGLDALYDEQNPYVQDNARGVGLRGPLIVTGWGWDIHGTQVGELQKSHEWKTGPVDMLWDDIRGVWSANNKVLGKTDVEITPGLSGNMTIWANNQSTGHKLFAYHWFSSGAISAGTKVMAEFFPYDNKWYITAADCV